MEFPDAFDRNDTSADPPPTSLQLNYLAELREEQDSSEGSSADEGAMPSGGGWTGTGKPMQVGVGYTVRDFCDGQSLASPERRPLAMVRHLEDSCDSCQEVFRTFRDHKAFDGFSTRTCQVNYVNVSMK